MPRALIRSTSGCVCQGASREALSRRKDPGWTQAVTSCGRGPSVTEWQGPSMKPDERQPLSLCFPTADWILRSHWPHAPDSSLHWWPRTQAPASPSSLKLLLVKVFGHGHGKNNCVKMGKFKGHRIFHCTNNGSKEPPQLSKHTEGDRGDLWRWRWRGEEITLDRKKARQSCFEEEADTLRWATWNKIDIGLRDESSFATQWLKTFPGYRICQALGHRNVLYQRTMTLSREVRKEQERVTGKKTQPGNAAHTVRSTIG